MKPRQLLLRTLLRLPDLRRTWLRSGDAILDDFLNRVEPGLIGSMRVRDASLQEICYELVERRDAHPMAGTSPAQASRTACSAGPTPQQYARRQRRKLLRRWLVSGIGLAAAGSVIALLLYIERTPQGPEGFSGITAGLAAAAGAVLGILLGYLQSLSLAPRSGNGSSVYTVGDRQIRLSFVLSTFAFLGLLRSILEDLQGFTIIDQTVGEASSFALRMIALIFFASQSWPVSNYIQVSSSSLELRTPLRTHYIPRSGLQTIEQAPLIYRMLAPWHRALRISWMEESGKRRSRVAWFNRSSDYLDQLQGESA